LATWVLGITKTCPGRSGLLSRNAIVCGWSKTIAAGLFPAAMLQNLQVSDSSFIVHVPLLR
jgi:hypothetical protein